MSAAPTPPAAAAVDAFDPTTAAAVCGRKGAEERSIRVTQCSELLANEEEVEVEVENEVGDSGTEGSAVEGGDSAGRATDNNTVSNFLFSPNFATAFTSE